MSLQLRYVLVRELAAARMRPADLCRKADVSRSLFHDWLAGGSPRNLVALKRVADVFGVTIDYLCFDTPKGVNGRADPEVHGAVQTLARRFGVIL